MFIQKQAKRATPAYPLTKRLAAYSRQAQQFRASAPITAPDWRKTALSALIPLAASAADAQCLGALPGQQLTPNQSFAFDVDGVAGNDFQISFFKLSNGTAQWKLTPLNPQFYFALGGTGRVGVTNVGASVTRNNFNFVNVQKGLGTGNDGAFGAIASASSPSSAYVRYIPIRKGNMTTGQPGWIKVLVTNRFPFGSALAFTIQERGLEATSNTPTNSAIVNDCASMASGVLAVELTNFNAAPNGKHIALNWQTATERDNSGFEKIGRASCRERVLNLV